MPRRQSRPPAVLLAAGEWVRRQINYTFVGSCGGAWSYRLDTLNLAHGQVSAESFLGDPDYYVDERGYLGEGDQQGELLVRHRRTQKPADRCVSAVRTSTFGGPDVTGTRSV